MKKLPLIAILTLISAGFAISAADAPRVSRAMLSGTEDVLSEKISRMWPDNPLAMVGPARGVYIPNYGAVISAEVNLVTLQGVSLMSPTPSDADKVAAKKKKLERIPILKNLLRDQMPGIAAMLSSVPATEQIVIAVLLPRYSWEEPSAQPLTVVLQGTKQQLMGAKGPALDAAIRISEY
ncbi:MAG: hypothetical protein ABI995_14735 [Acidobacteriota bacterium]